MTLKYRPNLFLLFIVLLGSALRLFNLNYQSLWYDELHSIIPTSPDFTVHSIIEYAKTDQPPLFFLYLHLFFKVFGYSEQMARLASAIIGILGIPAVYFLGKEIKDKEVGLFASLLACVNYYQLYYSQEVRFYGLAFLLSTLSFLFFIKVFKKQTFTHGLFYVITTSALLYTHYYGIIIFVAQFIIFIVLAFYKRERQFIYGGFFCGVVVGISFIPWLPTVLHDSYIQSFWIQKPDVLFLVRYFYDYVGKDLVSSIVFLVLGVLFLLEWRRAVGTDKSVFGIVAGWIVLSYLMPYLKSIVGTPLLYIRYTIVTLPAWFILLALGWRYINHHRLRIEAVSIILFSSLLNLTWRINFYYRIEKSQYREITQLVKDKNTNALPVLSAFSWHFNFYFRNHSYKVAQLPSQNFPNKFWLLQSHSAIEMSKELDNLKKDFLVKESINLYQTNAYLLQAK